MAFEPGNKHAAKSRLFDAALKRAIAQDDGEKLRKAAEKLLDLAAEGSPWAIGQLADRLDGKAAQSVTVERKNVSALSLSELSEELASAIAAGGAAQDSGPEGSAEVH